MKHIQKRFLNEINIGQPVADLLNNYKNEGSLEPVSIESIPKDYIPYFTTDDNKFYQAFQLKINGKTRIIPEPDPILLYFHTAYTNYRLLDDAKRKLLDLTEITLGKEPAINELYEYFGMISSVVIFLFTTIEATINRCVPYDYSYTRVSKNKTEIFNKEQIERALSFDEKIKQVLTNVTNKNFEKSHPLIFKHILNLKLFRDDIIHTKSHGQGISSEKHNYSRAFSFDYDKTIQSVKEFCNFYIKPDFIVDCPCSQDW